MNLIVAIIVTTLSLTTSLYGQTGSEFDRELYLEALKAYSREELDNALTLFNKVLKSDKESDAALYYLANIGEKRGELGEAIGLMKKAIELDRANLTYREYLAYLYQKGGMEESAKELYEEIRQEHPGESQLYYQLIDLYTKSGEYDAAERLLSEIEERVGVSETLAVTKFELMLKRGETDGAYNYLIEVDSQHPFPRSASLLGDWAATTKQDSLAEHYYSRALELAPGYPPAQYGIAELYRIQGKYHLYFENITPFITDPFIEGEVKKGYMEMILSNIKFVQLFLPQVDSMMRTLYSFHPTDTAVIYQHALFLVQSDNSEEAITVLERNVERNLKDKRAHQEYLSLLYYLERWEELIERAQQGLIHIKDDRLFIDIQAISNYHLERYSKAIEHYTTLLKICKTDTERSQLQTYIADIHYKTSDKKRAYKHYRKAVKLNPNNIVALNNWAYHLSEEKEKLERALAMSKKVIEVEPNNITYLDTYGWILHQLGRGREAKEVFRQIMLLGGKEEAVLLDHYADVLYSLNERELAIIYWNQADKLDPSLNIGEKVKRVKEGEGR